MSANGKFANHDPKTISVFEVIGSYFTDTIFNIIYSNSSLHVTGGSSLTDEYTRRIQAFMTGVKNNEKHYGEVVAGVHRFFTGLTRFTAMSFSEFVNRVVSTCVPEEYFRQFSEQDKDEMLSSIICDLVANLVSFATRPEMLRRIIDEHNQAPNVTIRMLQDAAVNALIAKKAAVINKFLRKAGQARDHISMDVVDDMKKALRRLVKEKAAANARAEAAEEAVGDLKEQLRAGRTREAKMRKLIGLLHTERDYGPEAAVASLRVPKHDNIAEDDPLDLTKHMRHETPHRERIAEVRGDDESSGESEEESGEEESSEEDRRPAPRKSAGKKSVTIAPRRGGAAVSANFFKTVAAAPARTTGVPKTASAVTSTTATAAPATAPAARQPPPMMANLLQDNTVDADTGDLDDILGLGDAGGAGAGGDAE